MERTGASSGEQWDAILDATAIADRADTLRLLKYLSEYGASEAELLEAARTGSLGALGLELALRASGDLVSFDVAAEQAGLQIDEAARLWRALGFPDPIYPPLKVTPSQIRTLRVFGQVTGSLLGAETTLQLARVLGSSVAQLAEAIVDSFRVNVEMPRRHQGEPYSEVVEDYVRTASVMIPALNEAIGDVLASHLVAVSRSSWALDEQRAAVTRNLTVGFADLVDYTRTTRTLSPGELAAAIGRFESRVGEIVSRYRGRVVKLIGDEVMFVVEDPGRAAHLALELIDELSSDPHLPCVRLGLAAGPVISHHGDCYGDTVNLAARLVKVAESGEVLISESIAQQAASQVVAHPVKIPPLKGYDQPVRTYRLTRRTGTG
jgi:adenylate cyclase